ncbi:YitT family protein [Agromyces sp. MMS17-SY077]|uniref:YitT family protein n=1 Tax=Agromyces seonyuensis TaxID=2662446 RepID=A0A6I4P7K1_9MICO|nr:YitT family protein [Agromyces seonyuensis]
MTATQTSSLPAVVKPAASPASPGSSASVPHSVLDNVTGLATGALLASVGLFILKSAGVATGGTAGVALLVNYATGWPLGVLFFVVNAPFFLLALPMKGWRFTLRSALTVAAVSVLSSVNQALFTDLVVDPVYGSVLGNLIVGVGLLIIFRHGSSVGGFSILAIIAQDRLGWRAGYVQLALDATVVLFAFTLLTPWMVAASLLGAAVLNLTLAINHRPGRYTGH